MTTFNNKYFYIMLQRQNLIILNNSEVDVRSDNAFCRFQRKRENNFLQCFSISPSVIAADSKQPISCYN